MGIQDCFVRADVIKERAPVVGRIYGSVYADITDIKDKLQQVKMLALGKMGNKRY